MAQCGLFGYTKKFVFSSTHVFQNVLTEIDIFTKRRMQMIPLKI